VLVHVEEYNPWWLGERDPVYEEWFNSPVRWVPPVLRKITLEPYALHFLTGPRQVGKTTALKILAHELARERDPRSVFYFSCDELSDYRELGEVLDAYLSARERWGVKSSVILLDEITFVEEWWRALKSRVDRGVFASDVIVVTGSASLELVAGSERFPGRRGRGRDIVMLPLSFREYVRALKSLDLPAVRPDAEDLLGELAALKPYERLLAGMFSAYLKTGGFPLPIREYFTQGRVTYLSHKTYLDWLVADWVKLGKNEAYLKELLTYLLEVGTTPVSWHAIARSTSISSPHTARDYVEHLEKLLVAKVMHWASPDGRVDYRKEKKVVLMDPFLYRVLSRYTRVEPSEPAVVEATVASHLSRVAPVYYWRDGTEVDVIAVFERCVRGFEVKWGVSLKPGRKPLRTVLLDRGTVPLFLAALES